MGSDNQPTQGMPAPDKKPAFPMHILGGIAAGVIIVGLAALVILGLVDRGGENGAVADAAPDLTFEVYYGAGLVPGETKKLSSFKGRPVVLNFWAGLCPPCRAEMPDFQAAAQQYEGQVVFLGIDVGPYVGLGNSQDARKLLEDLDITYPTGLALDSDDVVRYDLVGLPSTYFLDASGAVKKKWAGYLPRDEMLSAIESLLKPS